MQSSSMGIYLNDEIQALKNSLPQFRFGPAEIVQEKHTFFDSIASVFCPLAESVREMSKKPRYPPAI